MKRLFILVLISALSSLCMSAQESYLTVSQQTKLEETIRDISSRFKNDECIGDGYKVKKNLLSSLKGQLICLMPSKYTNNTYVTYLEANPSFVKKAGEGFLANYKRMILTEAEEQEIHKQKLEISTLKTELAEIEQKLSKGGLNQEELNKYNSRSKKITKIIQYKEKQYQLLSEKFNVAFEQQNYLRLFEGIDLLVTKVKENNLTVKIEEIEFQINSGFNNLLLKSKVEELCNNIAQLKAEAEQEAQEEHERKISEWKQNIDLYYSSVTKMNQAASGPIAVKKKERAYDGTIRFRDFYQIKQQYSDFDSFIDEKYVFDIKDISAMIAKYEEDANDPTAHARSRDFALEELRKLRAMETDTFAICNIITNNREEWHFIDLRTGEPFNISNASKVESLSYLNNLSKAKKMVYDGKYSIIELLSPDLYKVDFPEKLCESLVGEKVYLISNNEYDEISNVEFVNGKYKVFVKKNGEIKNIKEIISVKWYEELLKYVGKNVLVVSGGYNIYQEDLQKYNIWTIEKIEVENKEYSGIGLYVTCSKDGKTAWADAAACSYLTHELDFESGKNFVHGSTSGFEESYGTILLHYDYVKANAPHMSEEQKAMVKSMSNFFGKIFDEAAYKYIYENMSLSQFRKKEPDAKQVLSKVENGNAIRVFHVKGYEVIFVNEKCTNVNKL